MVLAKVFCMTKNEYDLIEDFIIYYGYLFGYENIIIIDNNSTHATVAEVYKKYKPLGVTIYYEPNYTGANQGINFTKYMNQYKHECEFLIGLDTDEFLFSCETTSFDKKDILKVLNNYSRDSTLFKISSYPCSVVDSSSQHYVDFKLSNPARQITTFSNDLIRLQKEKITFYWKNTSKFFCRSNAFLTTSNGNHILKVSHGNQIQSSLGLLHFHEIGKKRQFERAKGVVDGYNYFSTTASIEEQLNILPNNNFGIGRHRVNQYHDTLLRKFLVELFEHYIKRAPTLNELAHHANTKVKMTANQIKEEFKNCKECHMNKTKSFSMTAYEKDKLIFDEDIENHFEIKGLQQKLMSLTQ